MSKNQIDASGVSCKESRQLGIKCDGMTPCGMCTERDSQGLYPLGQLSRANNLSTLLGSEQHAQSVRYHMQNVECSPCHANSLNTRESPLSSGDLKDFQERLSIPTAQPCKISSHLLEDNYPAKWDPAPILYRNEALAQGMDACQVQPDGPLNRLSLPFETVYATNIYTPPLLQSIHTPTSSNAAPGVYKSGSGQVAHVPLLAPSRRSDLRFGTPYDPIYRPELAYLYPQDRHLVASSSWESEIGRQPPATNIAHQFNGLFPSLSRGDTVLQGPMRGIFSESEFGCARGDSVYGQVRGATSLKEPSHPRFTRSRKPPVGVRARITTRRDHYSYQDDELRRKYPKERQHVLELAIGFQKEHGHTKGIPPDLLDKLLEKRVDNNLVENRTDDKYYCFCCPNERKARTITPARDHVRKSLGNFPFRCLNPWCRHSSLRQADLNKHMKTCTKSASSAPKGLTSTMQNPEVTGPVMQDQGSVDPHSNFNVADSLRGDSNAYTAPPSAAGFGPQNYQA